MNQSVLCTHLMSLLEHCEGDGARGPGDDLSLHLLLEEHLLLLDVLVLGLLRHPVNQDVAGGRLQPAVARHQPPPPPG